MHFAGLQAAVSEGVENRQVFLLSSTLFSCLDRITDRARSDDSSRLALLGAINA